MKISAVDRRH